MCMVRHVLNRGWTLPTARGIKSPQSTESDLRGRIGLAMRQLLADVTVIDLTRGLAGPHARMMLGDLGARATQAGGLDEHLPAPRLGPHDDGVRAWLDEMDAKEGS
jgi:hypothetical protein